MVDYYTVLDLKRDFTDSQIKQAYRTFALKYHPHKHSAGKERESAERQFRLISEAYEVLNDPERRSIFDQYGEKGLKEGIPNSSTGGRSAPYVFRTNPDDLFSDHFGTTSPFVDLFDPATNQHKHVHQDTTKKVEPQQLNLYVSLEELWSGCTKKVKAVRKKVNLDGADVSLEERVLSVEIGAGWKNGTKVTFSQQGDEAPGYIPGDLIYTLREKPHPRFVRKGNDLHYAAQISLLQALTGTILDIETLDSRILPIALNEIATPDGNKVVAGEGMPNPKNPNERGNLVIEFSITFPSTLTISQKNSLKQILPP